MFPRYFLSATATGAENGRNAGFAGVAGDTVTENNINLS